MQVSSSPSSTPTATWVYYPDSALVTAPAQVNGGIGELQDNGSSILWEIAAPVTGEYRISLEWSSPYGNKVNSIVIDGIALSFNFTETTTPIFYTQTKTLTAGNHTFGVQVGSNDWGYVNVHSIKLELLGGLTISSPENFAQLPSGSNIPVIYEKLGEGNLTYSVNDGATVVYQGASPLIIPTQSDGIYRVKFGMEGTTLSTTLRVTVGTSNLPDFVEAAGTQFVLNNKPFYFNGSNQYYLMYKPEPMTNDFFDRAAALNMKVVRTWMFCNGPSTHDGVCINKKSDSGFILVKPEADRTAEEKAIIARSFELFDNYVAQAESRNMRLVLSLSDHWDYFGKIEDYGPYSSSGGRALFKTFITNLLNHVNPLTGKAYKDDPTIMMWELANEPRYTTSNFPDFKIWVADIAAHIKSIAPNQLVSIGSESSFGAAFEDTYSSLVELNSDPNIDAISGHIYPTAWSMTDEQVLDNIQKLADLAREVGKPAYIGELGWPVDKVRTTGSQTESIPSGQAAIDAFLAVSLAQRANYMEAWYAKAYANKDAIGGFLIWQLSGKEWGNGGTPLHGCQWCAGPYGEPSGGWSGNHDGYQFYCALNEEEMSLTQLGAVGSNKEGDKIHINLHKPSCDVIKQYSAMYELLLGNNSSATSSAPASSLANSSSPAVSSASMVSTSSAAPSSAYSSSSTHLGGQNSSAAENSSAAAAAPVYVDGNGNSYPWCQYPEDDGTIDGWGWENNTSCKVPDAQASSANSSTASAGLSSSASSIQPTNGFHIQQGALIDANGHKFVMKGVNLAHAWYQDRTNSDLEIIANYKSNTVRVVLANGEQWSRTSAASLQSVINKAKSLNMIVVAEVHDSTGYPENSAAAHPDTAIDYWLANDIKEVLFGEEAYVIINLANEPFGNNANAMWSSWHQSAIQRMRNAGYRHTLMVDAANWGQDWSNTMRDNAAAVFEADPDRNTMFSVHMYEVYGGDKPDSESSPYIYDYIQSFISKNLVLVVGEFADIHYTIDKNVNEQAIFAHTASMDVGYLAWSWTGNDNPILDIWNLNGGGLTTWGEKLMDNANGILQSAAKATVFE